MMTRRSFIARVMSAVAGGMVLDVERLLWVPGAKSIMLPSEAPFLLPLLQVGDVFTVQGISQQFIVGVDEFSDHVLTRLRRNPKVRLQGNICGQILGSSVQQDRQRAQRQQATWQP
jgi:hypothetical protein